MKLVREYIMCGIVAVFLGGGHSMANAVPVPGTIVLSTLGPGDSYNRASAYFINQTSNAAGFDNIIPNLFLTQLDLALGLSAGTDLAVVKFLSSDAFGLPSSVALETWTVSGLPPYIGGGSVVSLTSTVNPLLVPGVLYWVAVFPGAVDTEVAWFHNSQGLNGVANYDISSSVWSAADLSPTPAYRVWGSDGSTDTAPVPEPASLILLVSGLAIMLSLNRKKKLPER